MSNTILRFVVDDIQKDFNQTFDDREITKAQVAYWVLLFGNEMRSQHIDKRSSGAFLNIFTGIPVLELQASQNPNAVEFRKHFILPTSIYSFNNDKAIDYVAYYSPGDPGCAPKFTKVIFNRTKPSIAHRLYMNKYEKPSPNNPFFYRAHEYVYLLGIENVNVKFIEVGLYTTFNPLTQINLDDPFDFPEELLAQLKRKVIDLGRFALQVPGDRTNDGSDSINPGKVPAQKLVSVQPQQEAE